MAPKAKVEKVTVEKAEKAVKAKRVKKPDDGKPKIKRGPSAFIVFSSEKRAQLKIEQPELSFGDTGRVLGKMWGDLDAKEKEKYQKIALSKKPTNA